MTLHWFQWQKLKTDIRYRAHLVMNIRRSITVAELWWPKVTKHFWCFFMEKRPLMVKFAKFCSYRIHRHVFCANLVKFGWRESSKIVHCLHDKKPKFCLALLISLLRRSRSKSARASPRHCHHSAPDFIQTGPLSVELYQNAWIPSKVNPSKVNPICICSLAYSRIINQQRSRLWWYTE